MNKVFNFKKYFKSFLILTIFLSLFSGCSKKTINHKYDLAIFDEKKIVTFSENNGELKKLKTINRKINKNIWNKDIHEFNDFYLTKTNEGDDFTVLLDKIDKNTLKETTKPAKGNDAFTSTANQEYFFSEVVFTDRLDFYKYDLDFNVVYNTSIENNETINAGHKFLYIDGFLYLLVRNVVVSSGEEQTELWKMNENFEIIEKINLKESSVFIRMINVNNKLYISEISNGMYSNGEYKGGNRIMVYDLDNHKKSYININTPYPNNMYYDDVNNNLIIEHEYTYFKNFPYTIINLSTMEEKVITFDEYEDNYYLPPFFKIINNKYYFLFNDKLVYCNPISLEKNEIDLLQFKIKYAHFIMSKN